MAVYCDWAAVVERARREPQMEGTIMHDGVNRTLSLSHMGIGCFDLPAQVDFYTEVLGMTITDRGELPGPSQPEAVFLTTDPREHHQLLLVAGRTEGEVLTGRSFGGSYGSAVFQLSFRLDSLATLRRMRDRLTAAGCPKPLPVNHGNGWSLYTRDPEGNTLEFVVDSPWYTRQPFGELLDLRLDDDEILRRTEAMVEAHGGEPIESWRRRTAEQIDVDQQRLS